MLGTSVFTAKAQAELQTWGLTDSRYLDVPHAYQEFDDAQFDALLADLVHDVSHLVGGAE